MSQFVMPDFATLLPPAQNGFVSSLVEDYNRWAASPALRAERQQKAAASAQ